MLIAEGLTKHFRMSSGFLNRRPSLVRAVDDVSLEIGTTETLALVGESGSGKTTTARLILRLIEPTAGRVLFQGQDVHALRGMPLRRFRKDVQVIFQDPRAALNPRRTVFEILRDPLLLHGLASQSEVRSIVAEILERVGLSPAYRYLDRYPREFSGGQLQRICVARAISLQPRLVVADEPVSALDVSVRAQILQLMQSLQQDSGLAYLFITHDLAVVRAIAHQVAVMYLGKIVESGPVESIFTDPLHPYTRALLSVTPVPNPRRARERDRIILHGEIPSPANPPSGCRFHTRCPFVMDACRTQEPNLRLLSEGHQVACHLIKG
ncbi:MAG: ATP-binding cassette domain-containing protein [Chloroflexi bacterium]|nr:ATP-binding cassette domain-containing protein [Chloroflexota bacterium]MCL5076084.1 ATP-binding cassette domain-containing protein [Chloroflexota bacterium]